MQRNLQTCAFILTRLEGLDFAQVSLRTQMQVYEFAMLVGERWAAPSKSKRSNSWLALGSAAGHFYSHRDELGLEKRRRNGEMLYLYGVVRQ
jgi:hypothetical protein